MSAYFQMGHDTENLVSEIDLNEFKGIIWSPVNRTPIQLRKHTKKFRENGNYDLVFDSQLYFPRSLRGKLSEHPYYPSDIDTSHNYTDSWWDNVILKLSDYTKELELDAVCSPVVLPKTWNYDYYSNCSKNSTKLLSALDDCNIRTLTTVIVNIGSLVDIQFVLNITSILSRPNAAGYYIVLVSEIDPRNEFSDAEELYGIMTLIRELQNTGLPVLVSHCSSDMILYKAGGASHCATGKFFNLRRFTKSRFEEPAGGGGQIAYWFEHSLLAFIRGADVFRLQHGGYEKLLGTFNSSNHWSNTIIDHLKSNPNKPWISLGWRQYLSWFGKTEKSLSGANSGIIIKDWLKNTEEKWLDLEDHDILFEEPRNNGRWIRPWRQALVKLEKEYNL